jgi:hypothetical protein
MAETTNILKLPIGGARSVAEELRDLATRIESGEFGEVHSVVWVADCGDMTVEVGLVGTSPLPGPAAHLILHMGMLKLVTG